LKNEKNSEYRERVLAALEVAHFRAIDAALDHDECKLPDDDLPEEWALDPWRIWPGEIIPWTWVN
jgi:hypothetical protein